ncbi:MAG: FlgD immunoglobulin-like domain containing protein [Candidatus Latescibacterota bacterium]
MQRSKSKVITLAFIVSVIAVAGLFTVLHSYVPRTITVDGSNDFLVANLMDNDNGDTQFNEIDLDSIFVTNDANKLYIGFGYSKGAWGGNQLGIMIAAGTPSGGATDAWGHAIAWNTAPYKPDYQAYCNMDNSWQELRKWNSGTTSWDLVYSGTGSLGWVNNTGFEEVGFNLTDLGVSLGDTIYLELISTQSGGTKGPLDCMANDDDQLSTPGSTTWDVASPVEIDSMVMYIVQVTGDTDPPVVLAVGDDAPGSLVEPGIDDFELRFSEAVDQTTAENASNYALAGTAASIDSVRRNPSFPSRVRVYLDTTLMPQSSFYSVTVTNVKDLNNNTIVANDTTNVGCFFRKGILFVGYMGLHLRQHSFPVDTFTVEGDLGSLSWAGCDNAFMTGMGDSTYRLQAGFTLSGSGCHTGSPTASETMEWKFMHQCTEYEPLSNRQHTLMSSGGAWDTLSVWWNNEEDFTSHAIDVIFTVDVNSMSPSGGSVVAINGSLMPLTFDVPSVTNMADDGNYPDDTASDGVYAVTVRFPAFSLKNVGYKYLFNDVYECQTEGNREVWLNDAAYDTVGGTNGPLVMPLQYYDRCSTIGRDVEVIFKVNALWKYPTSGDTIAVNGTPNNQLPEVINWNVPSTNPMRDDGVYPDDTAGDYVYATSITFPDSSAKFVEYKYLFNSEYECTTQSNRFFYIDDTYDAVGSPQVLELDNWNLCETTGTEGQTPATPFKLHQNYPNPFNPTTTISFDVQAAGRAVLRIYNVKGELVRTLLDGGVEAGNVRVSWDGKDRQGRPAASGIYFYNLQADGKSASRKMVLIR